MKELKTFSNTLEKMTLKELRESKNLSQNEFAKTLGVTRSTYSCWELGRNGLPEEMKNKIAETFNCEIAENSKQIVLTGELEQPIITKGKDKYGYADYQLCVSADELENSLRNDFNNFTKTFFNIGFKLTMIDEFNIYKERGFETLEDYAKNVFNIGKSSMYAYMKVYTLTHDSQNPDVMKNDFSNYNYSQLEAMTSSRYLFKSDLINRIPPSTDRDDIRKYCKAYDKSFTNGDSSRFSWKTVEDGINYLEENKKPKTDSVPEQAPGQRYINDDSSIDDYNIEPEENQEPERNCLDIGNISSVDEFNDKAKILEASNNKDKRIELLSETIEKFFRKNQFMVYDFANCSVPYKQLAKELTNKLTEYFFFLVSANALK